MPVAALFVFLFAVPALSAPQAGPCAPRPLAFDPYKPSDLAVLRQVGSSVLANAPISSLLQLDPYVPSQALLLRQYGGALPIWPFVWYPAYVQPGTPSDCGPEVAPPESEAPAVRPITTFAELLTRLEPAPAFRASAPASAGRSAAARTGSVERTAGASIEYEGRRWTSAGRAVEFDEALFVRVGESAGTTVYRERGSKDEVIFVPSIPGRLAPFRAVSR